MASKSNTLFNSLKPKEKEYLESDGQGLHLLVKPNGKKIWQFIYTSPETNKRRKKPLGEYPLITLGEARKKTLEYRVLIQNKICPIEHDRRLKAVKNAELEEIKIKQTTFKNVAELWLKSYQGKVSENYHDKISRALELYTYSFVGNKPINEIKRLDLISIIEDLKNRDLQETARRTFQLINSVFKYAVIIELIPRNIVAEIDKKVVLGKKEINNYPTFTKEEDIKGLLFAIDDYEGDLATQKAMKILPYLFVRSFNLRHMEWTEIDLAKREWTIPKEKMKMKKDFILPLPNQVITVLEEMKQISENQKYVFPSFRLNKPLSDNTFITALRRMGYTKEELVPHSFRSIFSTIANENTRLHGHSYDVIEKLLAHDEKNKSRKAYNHAEYKEPKRELIQWYADYLDSLKGK